MGIALQAGAHCTVARALTLSTPRFEVGVNKEELVQASVDVDQLFDTIDADGNGTIERNEFVDAMKVIGTENLLALQQALPRAELSGTTANEAVTAKEDGPVFFKRMPVTLEVMVSKIFPAGFGWQLASCFADSSLGLQDDSLGFALVTGFGDGIGVFLGHTLYMVGKSAAVKGISVTEQAQVGLQLGTAAVFSGTAWQPVVNMLTSTGAHFSAVAAGTTALCGLAFFTGLRVARIAYSPIMSGVAPNDYSNLKADALLSVAIGGATGAFVGTDVGQIGNWLAPVFGIVDGTPDLIGSAIAGSSTATGFLVFQTVENAVLTKGKNWVD